MALFRVSSPDGAAYDVTAPEGATEDDVLAQAQAFHVASTAGSAPLTAFQNANVNTANQLLQEPRVRAFLGALGNVESGNRYNVIVGGGTFGDYSQHPNITVGGSSEAGAYQFNHGTWGDEVKRLGLTDFSPPSQDLAAVDLLNRLGALPKLLSNDVDGAIFSAAKRWDSLPLDQSQRSHSGAIRSLDSFRNNYFGRLQ